MRQNGAVRFIRGREAAVTEKSSSVARSRKTANGKTQAEVSVALAGGPTRRSVQKPRAELLENRILEAAVHEFSEHGFSGARIERISQRAGTVDRMLYYYYGNKERLYQAVLEKIYADMIGAQRDFVMSEDDPVEGMRQLIAHAWDHYVNHPDLVRLLMNENLLRGKHIQQSATVKRTSFPLVETVESLLTLGQQKGVFRRDVSSEHVLMTIMSLGFFYVSNQYTCAGWLGVDLMSKARRNAWLKHICAVVLEFLEVPEEPTAQGR
jgi:AcrR family transcriptional regulator